MVKASWSGSYPCLCYGEWTLEVDDFDYSDFIPKELRNNSMNTYDVYEKWHFNDNMEEEFESYMDGLTCDDWIKENKYWLDTITKDNYKQLLIYYEINKYDFRAGSCGGCI